MLKLRVDASELNKLVRDLKRFRRALEDRTDPMNKIKRYQARRWAVNFNSQGSIYGEWTPLSEITIQMKGNSKMLYETGAMKSHFLSVNNAGIVTMDAVRWTFDDVKMVSHHFGSFNVPWSRYTGPTNNPSRLLWDINDEDEDFAERELEKWVDRIVAKHFGG